MGFLTKTLRRGSASLIWIGDRNFVRIWTEHRDAGASVGASAGDSPRCCQHRARPSLGAVASGLVLKGKVQPVSPKFTAAEFQPPTLDGATRLRDRASVYSSSSQSPRTFPWGTPSSVCDTPDTTRRARCSREDHCPVWGSRSRVPRSLHLSLDTTDTEPQPSAPVQPTCARWGCGAAALVAWKRI